MIFGNTIGKQPETSRIAFFDQGVAEKNGQVKMKSVLLAVNEKEVSSIFGSIVLYQY